MVQRIDANTEDVVDNVQGAQRELMKYWSRVSGNRWLVAKMFGVLMVSLIAQFYLTQRLIEHLDILSFMGSNCGLKNFHKQGVGICDRVLEYNKLQPVLELKLYQNATIILGLVLQHYRKPLGYNNFFGRPHLKSV